MNPYFVVADTLIACGFIVIAGLTCYRHFKQGRADPALRHLLPMTIVCVVAAVSCVVRNWYPPAAVIEACAIGMLSAVLWWYTPALMAQPTMLEILAILHHISKMEGKVGEILDHVTEESDR